MLICANACCIACIQCYFKTRCMDPIGHEHSMLGTHCIVCNHERRALSAADSKVGQRAAATHVFLLHLPLRNLSPYASPTSCSQNPRFDGSGLVHEMDPLPQSFICHARRKWWTSSGAPPCLGLSCQCLMMGRMRNQEVARCR